MSEIAMLAGLVLPGALSGNLVQASLSWLPVAPVVLSIPWFSVHDSVLYFCLHTTVFPLSLCVLSSSKGIRHWI